MSNLVPTAPSPASEYGARFRPRRVSRVLSPTGNLGDALFRGAVFCCALLLVGIVLAMFAKMISNSGLSIKEFGFGFVTGREWNPIQGRFGALPFVYGTVVSSLLALVFAVPLSLGVAVFLVEQAPRSLSRPPSL